MSKIKLAHIALMVLLIAALLLALQGCAKNDVEAAVSEEQYSMFVCIERTNLWSVVYHNDTHVMYAVSRGGYNCGNFTLLVDAEGKPLIYNP